MWSDWQPEVIEKDLELLVQTGVETVRVFPLWPDFQPIHLLRKESAIAREYRHGEEPLPPGEEGQSGLSPVMMDRFELFADLLYSRGLGMIPALITGWMSGRLFVPPALEGRNVLTDPEALMWQVRFARGFVRRFRNHPALVAWDLGNECNCMAAAGSRAAAWQWTASITHAIRAEDPLHRVISGMHSLAADPAHPNALWTIEDQGELTDMLTIHPYPIFTPHCDRDPLNTLRGGLHAAAEGALYADISGKPCFAEEVGTLGPFLSSEEVAGDYLRTVLYSLWSHGNRGLLWWCGFDQRHLEKAPYDWCAVERELGLFRADFSPKPVGDEMRKFGAFLKEAPQLPPRLREAVCVVTEGQDTWGAAFASFLLAKQAGFDLEFQTATQPLKDSSLYLLPSLMVQPSRRFGIELMEKVRAGATLYVSLDNVWFSDFQQWFGMEVTTRRQRGKTVQIDWAGQSFSIDASYRFALQSREAEVLGAEPDGNPAFTRSAYGKGTVYLLTVPLETFLIRQPDVFHDATAAPFHRFYEEVSANVRQGRVLGVKSPQVGVTEHPRDDRFRYAVLVNYGSVPVRPRLGLREGWRVARTLRGASVENEILSLPANDAAVLALERTG